MLHKCITLGRKPSSLAHRISEEMKGGTQLFLADAFVVPIPRFEGHKHFGKRLMAKHGDTSRPASKFGFLDDPLQPHLHYILNTPNCARCSIGAFSVAAKASPSTSRVCTGSMTPSSHRRAVA